MPDDPLSLTFAALADPTRRALLARLATGQATVNELAEPIEMSLQAVSKHLKVLERAGLITRGKDAQYRPCRFEAEPLDTAIDWIEQHRQVWTERFDKLEHHLRAIQQPSHHPSPNHRTPTDKTNTKTTKTTKTTKPKENLT
jgi:DNA-binding transcriptional ArsR family regulator